MIHADCVRCKGIEDEFVIVTTTQWILGLDILKQSSEMTVKVQLLR